MHVPIVMNIIIIVIANVIASIRLCPGGNMVARALPVATETEQYSRAARQTRRPAVGGVAVATVTAVMAAAGAGRWWTVGYQNVERAAACRGGPVPYRRRRTTAVDNNNNIIPVRRRRQTVTASDR